MVTNDTNFTREIKFRIFLAKSAFNKENATFTSKLDLNLRKKLVKYYIWNTVICMVLKIGHFGK
jgi:hypothetical protein